MTVQNGGNCMDRSNVYERVQRFKVVRTNVVYDMLSGHPSNLTCTEVKEQIDKSIRDNRRMSIY